MPYLTVGPVRHRMAKQGYKYVPPLAKVTGLNYGVLRNAISGCNPIHLADIYVLAEALRGKGETVEDVVRDIVAGNEGVPDEPPNQPAKPAGPPRRQDTEDKRTGPKRATDSGCAA